MRWPGCAVARSLLPTPIAFVGQLSTLTAPCFVQVPLRTPASPSPNVPPWVAGAAEVEVGATSASRLWQKQLFALIVARFRSRSSQRTQHDGSILEAHFWRRGREMSGFLSVRCLLREFRRAERAAEQP